MESDFDDPEIDRAGPLEPQPAPSLDLLGPLAEATTAVQVRAALTTQAIIGDEQGCSVPKVLAVNVGDQVRITRNSSEYALYTVSEKRKSDNPNLVRLGLDARLRLGTSAEFSASLATPVVAAANLTDAQAEAAGELVERLVDDGVENGLVVIAPHGGAIEINTDLQAATVATALASSSWICKGWKVGGGAYERWHITSTKISPASFPKLAQIANRGFAYGVAFHGMSSGGVLIGGAAPLELKQMVKTAIIEAIGDATISVTVASPTDLYNADSPSNVVNWLTAGGLGGLQIEQDRTVRTLYWQAVCNAVIDVFAQLI
ncbi:poly-gamma-glutamate hydrolase family protein [Nannocystaceae bacterium ST9]